MNKTMRVEFRLSETEYKHLEKMSEISGLSKSALFRQFLNRTEIKPKPPEQIGELLRALQSMERYINQIAKVASSTNIVKAEDIEKIQKMQEDIWRKIKRM